MSSDFPFDRLPSTFYRVTVKGLIFDEKNRLLVCMNEEGGYELPGGGLEHGETLGSCLKRELKEELGAELLEMGDVVCVYDMRSPYRNVPVIRIAVRATIRMAEFQPGDSIVSYRYVAKEEFMTLSLEKYEGPINKFVDSIWTD